MTIPITHRRDVADAYRAIDRLIQIGEAQSRQRDIAAAEKQLAALMRRVFRRQERDVLALVATLDLPVLREASVPDIEKRLGSVLDKSWPEFLGSLVKIVGRVAAFGFGGLWRTLTGTDGPKTNPMADYARQHSSKLITGLNETTAAEVRALVAQAIEQGLTSGQLAEQLREKFAQFHTAPSGKVDRAALIAQTEMLDAYEAGAEAAARQMDGTVEKRWVTMQDDLVDPHCEANEGEGWVPIDHEFGSGHTRPLAHPNCRCRCEYRKVKP